jgi:hypothetical protein
MKGVFKNEDCPSSNELLEYQNGDLVSNRSREITRHLAVCEFCDAEAEFYSNYPQAAAETEVVIETAAIPEPLFELAEALLKRGHTDAVTLNALLKEKEERLVSDAV